MLQKLVFILLCGTLALHAEFEMKNGELTITTLRLQLKTSGGMIPFLKDRQTGEVFTGKINAVSEIPFRKSLIPDPSKGGVFKQNSSDTGVLSYPLEGGARLSYEFKTEENDILVRVHVENYDLEQYADNLDLHVMALTPRAMITGIGSRTLRRDPAREETLLWPGAGFYFPRVAIAEGKDGVLLFHSESSMPYHNLIFYHTPEADHLVLRGGDNNLLRRTGKLLVSPKGEYTTSFWRIGAHRDWLSAAKSWREQFEKRTGAVPLWKNPSRTVRNTHAVFTGTPNLGWKENPDEYYKELAQRFNPENLLLFYWNAHSILVFGDPRYAEKPYPAKESVEALKKHGFQWIGFHGYTLLCNPSDIRNRLEKYFMNRVPEGYSFRPDYDGPPTDFYKNMEPYFSIRSGPLGMVNPAAKYVEDYLVRNIKDYAAYHRIPGFYLDITGAVSYALKPGKVVFEGKTYYDGDVNVFRCLRREAPELAMMSEYCGEWTLPYFFYTWEAGLVFRHPKIRINHPLRGALYGSYIWARESTVELDPVKNAYYATLPEVVLGIGSARLEEGLTDPWFNERAKLFIDHKLFNDLPEKWEDEVLACYRSDKNEWFQFRKMPFGYAYTKDGTVLLGICENVRQGVAGFSIPAWPAYDAKDCALGLNPKQSYRFIREKTPRSFTISSLPENVFVSGVRKQADWTVVSLDSDSLKEAEIAIDFHQKPFRVLLNGKEVALDRKMYRIPLPGSLLVVEKEPKVIDGGKLPTRNGWSFGHYDAEGLPASNGFRGWSFDFNTATSEFSFAGQKKLSVDLGPGRFGSYAERFVKLPDGKAELSFSTAMKNTLKDVPMHTRIQVNGQEVFRETTPSSDAWREQKVNLDRFAGQTVLLTFSYQFEDPAQARPVRTGNIAHFGSITIR